MVDVLGIVVVLVFYVIVLISGILATRWFKRKQPDGATSQEMSLVAGRKLGMCVGIFTMTATTVGGGYINGTAESIATMGLAWTLAPFGICAGLIIGGAVFARKMREQNYLTMFDPFQQKYGHTMVALLYLTAICGDIFWASSVLAALGTSLSVLINLPASIAMITSALVTVVYVMFGQVISVAYTDVIQLVLITMGMVLAIPYVLTNPAVQSLASTQTTWVGHLSGHHGAAWADLMIAMTLGTIPWQTYFQRVLSVKTYRYAQALSMAGGVGAFVLGIPPALMGVVAVSTDWNQTSLGESPLVTGHASLVLPLVLKHLTPRAVSLIGLSAVAAAVMSSIDSAILSSASVFTHNIYKMVLRTKASDTELMWIQRAAVLVVGTASTILAIFVPSIYGMFILAADIVFVIMFPQLLSVVYIPVSNTYGSLCGLIVGAFLRLASGEPILSLNPLLKYPFYDFDRKEQLFPFRTFAMLCSLLVIVAVSHLSKYLFTSETVSLKYDKFQCFKQDQKVVTSLEGISSDKLPLNHRTTAVASDHDTGDIITFHDSPDRETEGKVENHFAGNRNTQNGYCVEQYSKKDCETNCGTNETDVFVTGYCDGSQTRVCQF